MEENQYIKEDKHMTPYLFSVDGGISDTGELRYWENNELFPKGIQRCFWVFDVDSRKSRGNHAHKTENQVIVAMHGVIFVKIVNLLGDEFEFKLSRPSEALFIPPLHWITTVFDSEAVLLGMTNEVFSEADYIRDREQFDSLKNRNV